MRSAITEKNQAENKGMLYVFAGHDDQGQRIALCPTTGRRFVARVTVCSSGFMVRQSGGGSIQQYDWTPRGGRAGLVEAARYLAKRTLEHSFFGRYGVVGYIREQEDCCLPNPTWEAWGYTRENAACGEVSMLVPCFDVLVPWPRS